MEKSKKGVVCCRWGVMSSISLFLLAGIERERRLGRTIGNLFLYRTNVYRMTFEVSSFNS